MGAPVGEADTRPGKGQPRERDQPNEIENIDRRLPGQITTEEWLGVCIGMAPAFGSGTKSRLVLGPIVKGSRVEVGSAWPDNGMNLRVERDLSESRRVAQRPVKLARKNRFEINSAHQAIVEAQTQRIRSDVLARGDAVKRMVHGATLHQRSDWRRLAALLQKRPIGEQFFHVKLGRGLNEPLLALRDETNDECNRRNGKGGDLLPVVGVEMGDVMLLRRLGEHPNNDTVKT